MIGGDTRVMMILLPDATTVPNYINCHGFDNIQMRLYFTSLKCRVTLFVGFCNIQENCKDV